VARNPSSGYVDGMRKTYAKRLLETQRMAERLMLDLIPKVYGAERLVRMREDTEPGPRLDLLASEDRA